MRSTILNALIKPIARRSVWAAKKKSIVQILQARCRRDGLPEYGHFIPREIDRVINQADKNIQALLPYFIDLDNLGNFLNEYGGLIDLAIYRALVKENIDPDYAVNLVGDMMWQARLNARGHTPVYDPLRIKLARLTTKNPLDFLEKRLRDGMKYPYGEPGYTIELYKDGDVHCMDIYTCPVYDFYKQFGQAEMNLFRSTWCTYDYSVAELLVEGGKYEREHTLSDGDNVCDMRWFIV